MEVGDYPTEALRLALKNEPPERTVVACCPSVCPFVKKADAEKPWCDTAGWIRPEYWRRDQ